MPNSIELQTSNQDNAENSLATPEAPSYSEHMKEQESLEQATPEPSVEERQKFIENPEERKAKIQSILQELTPDDIDDFGDFEPEKYHGDNANDFFWSLGDNFILQHIDDLMACGVKAETVDEFAKGLFADDAEDKFIDNIDSVLSHVGHGITFDTFMEICQVDLEDTEGDPLIPAAKYILDTAFDYNGGEVDASTYASMLKNGFTADEILASNPTVERGFDESIETLLDAGADPTKIAELYIEQGEQDHLRPKLDMLISRGAKVNVSEIAGDTTNDSAGESFVDFVEDHDDAQIKEKLNDFIANGTNIGYIISYFCYKDGSVDENGTKNINLNLFDSSIAKGFEDLLQYVDINQVLPHLSTETIAMNTKYLKQKGANLEPYEKNIDSFFGRTEQEMKSQGLA